MKCLRTSTASTTMKTASIGATLSPTLSLLLLPFSAAKATTANLFVFPSAVELQTNKALYEKLNITKISQLYQLQYNDLEVLEGFKSKKINNLLESIESSKNPELSSFIYSLGINGVGSKTAKDLAKNFGTLSSVMTAKFEDLLKIKDIGDTIAENIVGFFKSEENIQLIKDLLNAGIVVKELNSDIIKDSIFTSKSVVLTGTLENMSRDEAKSILQNNDLDYEIIGNGETVISQTPSPNDTLYSSLTKIILYQTLI